METMRRTGSGSRIESGEPQGGHIAKASKRKKSTVAPSVCPHAHFQVNVQVDRIFDEMSFSQEEAVARRPDRYAAVLTVSCKTCGESMLFVGMPRGLSSLQPMMSFTGDEARLPFWPATEEPTEAMRSGAGYTISGDGVLNATAGELTRQ